PGVDDIGWRPVSKLMISDPRMVCCDLVVETSPSPRVPKGSYGTKEDQYSRGEPDRLWTDSAPECRLQNQRAYSADVAHALIAIRPPSVIVRKSAVLPTS